LPEFDMSTADLRKAAVVLLSLPRHQAADLLDQLDPWQMESLTEELANKRPISAAERSAVASEFAAAAMGAGATAPVPRATSLAADFTHAAPPAPFAMFSDVDSQILFRALASEHPQTIALVLSHLPVPKAAQIISRLSPELGPAVVRRLATIGPVSEDARADVEHELARRVARFTRR
jgi:flagellar motor switch protein FliG